MKTILTTTYFFILIFLAGMLPAHTQDATELLNNMYQIMFSPKDKQANVKIILTNKSGKEKVQEAVMMQKGTDKKLYRFTQPESQAGRASLSLPGGVIWMYMPAFGTTTKMTLFAKSQAFNGTDFSTEDMATTPYQERFTPTLIETNDDAFVLELIPISKKSNYSKIIVRLNKTNFYPILMEYFNKGGVKVKEATYKYQQAEPYWYAKEVVMTTLKKDHSTKILLTEVKFDQGLSDDLFTVENLKPVKSSSN